MRYYLYIIVCLIFISSCSYPGRKIIQVTKLKGYNNITSSSVSEIRVYTNVSGIECNYKRIALITAKRTFNATQSDLINDAKNRAAKLGSNGLIVKKVNIRGFGGGDKSRFVAIREDRPCESPTITHQSQTQARSIKSFPAHLSNVDPTVVKALSLPSGAKKVESSETESLQEGDVIISIEGAELTQEDSLEHVVAQHSPGDIVQLGIFREGQNKTVSVTLGGDIN